MIAWYDNIPILSFLALRGRCRACAMPIPWRYPLVEAVTAGLFLAAYQAFGPTPDAVVAAVLLAALRGDHGDRSSAPDHPRCDLAARHSGRMPCQCGDRTGPWIDSLLGIVVGGGLFMVIILASGGGMGGGYEAGRYAWCLPRLESRPGRGFRGRHSRRHSRIGPARVRQARAQGSHPVWSFPCSRRRGRTLLRRKGGAVVPRRLQRIQKQMRGFTMTELIVVVAVIGIIMAVGAPTLWTHTSGRPRCAAPPRSSSRS